MRAAGYTDVERGERGSTEEHLTVTQFKVQAEQERLADLTQQAQQKAAEAKALDREIEKRTQKKSTLRALRNRSKARGAFLVKGLSGKIGV